MSVLRNEDLSVLSDVFCMNTVSLKMDVLLHGVKVITVWNENMYYMTLTQVIKREKFVPYCYRYLQ